MQTNNASRLRLIIQKIDEANAKDPNTEVCTDTDAVTPKELLYSQRMTKELLAYAPSASEHLQIAARAQHIERWTSPRTNYPEGRAGYKKWRAELSLFHANRTSSLMAECGYTEEDCEQVKFLIQKRQLRRNPDTQTLEDVICLVFLKYYFADFSSKHEEPKLIDILQKTWAKMSEKGHQAALTLDLPPHLLTLVSKALT